MLLSSMSSFFVVVAEIFTSVAVKHHRLSVRTRIWITIRSWCDRWRCCRWSGRLGQPESKRPWRWAGGQPRGVRRIRCMLAGRGNRPLGQSRRGVRFGRRGRPEPEQQRKLGWRGERPGRRPAVAEGSKLSCAGQGQRRSSGLAERSGRPTGCWRGRRSCCCSRTGCRSFSSGSRSGRDYPGSCRCCPSPTSLRSRRSPRRRLRTRRIERTEIIKEIIDCEISDWCDDVVFVMGYLSASGASKFVFFWRFHWSVVGSGWDRKKILVRFKSPWGSSMSFFYGFAMKKLPVCTN